MSTNPAVTDARPESRTRPRSVSKGRTNCIGRFENTLTDADGKKVELKQGAQVEVTVEGEAKDTAPKTSQDALTDKT